MIFKSKVTVRKLKEKAISQSDKEHLFKKKKEN